MGEQADMILEGFLCEECFSIVDGEEPGYPRKCADCQPKSKPRTRPGKKGNKHKKPKRKEGAKQ